MANPNPVNPPRSCECGFCVKCKRRDYMRKWRGRNVARARAAAARSYERNAGGLVIATCEWCEFPFVVTGRKMDGHARRYCTRGCKESHRKALLRYRRAAAKPDRACRHCGKDMPKTMRVEAAYCSEECNSNAHSQTRKASRRIGARQERVDRAYIIERDGGRCHLCKRQVPDGLITIDHLIPLAAGGTHSPENLAVACLPCNCAKGARPANEQLLLVG